MTLPLWKTLGRYGTGWLLMASLGLSVSAPRAAPPSSKPATSAPELARSAQELIKVQQFQEAEHLLRQCVDVDPHSARCHLLLGATLARTGKIDEAATHYRDFLRLAPQDPSAAKVKKMLEDYDRSRAHK